MSEPTQTTGQAHGLELALRAARESAGSARDVERLRAQLQLKLLHEAPAAAPADATPPAASVSVGKLALVGASLLALGALYAGLNRSPATAPAPTTARAVSSARSPTARALFERASAEHGMLAPPLSPRITAPAQIAEQAERHSTQAPPHAPRATAPAQTVADRGKPTQRAHSHTPGAPAERSGDLQPAAARADSATEIALVTRAQGLLDLQPSAALAVLLEHERQFPRGILAEERDVLRVEAERALGRTRQAIAHAKAFCAQYPNSPQTRTLEHWLAAQLNTDADHK